MQTFLITSDNAAFIEDEIEKKKAVYNASPLNYHEIIPSPSFGIENVRQLKHLVSQKPAGGGGRLIVLKDMQLATIEAQHALLKILEEPPESTCIMLITTSEASLLPTITSRVTKIKSSMSHLPEKDLLRGQQLLADLCRESAGKRILLAQKLAVNREETKEILVLLIQTLERLLWQETPAFLTRSKTVLLLKKTEMARQYVERNVNFKAVLDLLFLGYPKTS